MEIIQGGSLVVFSGKAMVTRGDSELRAERLVQNKRTKLIEASGAVDFKTLTQDREPLAGKAEKAKYDVEQGQGELWGGRPNVVYSVKASTTPLNLTADRIQFDERIGEIRASGAVEVISSSASAYSPYALFEHKEQRLILNGPPQPSVLYRNQENPGTFTADRITLLVDQRKIILEGAAHGTVFTRTEGKKLP
jgi:lipopolysaccharide export system protein LptA